MRWKMLPRVRALCDGLRGENYWFHGCMAYLMACLGEPNDYDYAFFSNVTGDSLTQLYSRDPRVTAWCCAQNLFDEAFARRAFEACGYDCALYQGIDAQGWRELLPLVRAQIDRGRPVIARGGAGMPQFFCICGYSGDAVRVLYGGDATPRSARGPFSTLLIAGEKTAAPPLAEVYRKSVRAIPDCLLRPATAAYSFGREAFLNWADSFQNGAMDAFAPGEIDVWKAHGAYLCIMGTNGCARTLLERAAALCPDLHVLDRLRPLYQRQQEIFHRLAYQMPQGADGRRGMEGGFDIRPETLRDSARMKPIGDLIRAAASLCDEILDAFAANA